MLEPKDIIRRYNALKAKRDGLWLEVWREARRYCMPTYSDFKTEGGVRGKYLFDTTAIEARERLAAGMFNWMAPPDKRWFELVPQDNELAKDEEVKDYFGEVTRIVAVSLANSNWASILIQALNNIACGLDAVVYCEDGGDQSVLSFTSFPIETVCYSEDSRGHVDTLFREVEMTARQLMQEFEEDHLPDKIREEAGNPDKKDTKHKILHGVFPRHDREKGCLDRKNMPFADVYIDEESSTIIYEGGFEEYPFAVCRFEKSDNETYGRGPGVNMLPTIKMANRMSEAYILGREHQSDPTYLVPDGSLIAKDFNRDPGAVIPYKPDINGSKPEMLPNNINFGTLFEDIAAIDEKIKYGFYWDIFDPLGDLKQITATEAEIRNEGKMIPFAPIAGNLHSELFRVIIHRVYGICCRRGMLPQPPPRLAENPDYKVEFVSKIALSIKKLETLGWLQTEASLMNIAQVKPDIIDNFDTDEIARSMALANGCAPNWLVNEKDRDNTRAARAEAAQQQQAAEQLLAGTSALGANLGKTPEKGSPLDAVMSGQGV
ncbi:MAG: head-tail connector protein [Lentisphaeria bacterium]|nr:head-tail connector protein [Lentisphaeria bacterium]